MFVKIKQIFKDLKLSNSYETRFIKHNKKYDISSVEY